MPAVVYEGPSLKNLFPLVYLRPTFNLRIGTGTVIEILSRRLKTAVLTLTRPRFDGESLQISAGPIVYLDGQFLLHQAVPRTGPDEIFICDGEVVGLRKNRGPFPSTLVDVQRAIKKIRTRRQLKGKYLKYLWDFIEYNSVAIELGFKPSACEGRCERGVIVEGPNGHLLVKRGARIGSGVYIDVRLGPVIVDEMAQVLPFSRIRGPCYIGPKTIIDGARIGGGCSFGPDCRVSGEVEASIFQGHTNKHHDGFLGHSFIGEWVNLGAGTTNSDLKNNYGPVRVMVGRQEVDTGLVKVGCFIGDHTKTGIGTLIPTGASLGVFVNFFGGGMTPRELGSFKWGSGQKVIRYRLEDAIKTAQTAMQRRGMRLTGSDENLIRRLYAELNRH